MKITFEFPKDLIPDIPPEILLMNIGLAALWAFCLLMLVRLYFNMKG